MVTNPQVRLTVRDYLDIPEDDENRYELIDGELYMAPAPSYDHQSGSYNLTLILGGFVSASRLGVLRYSPFDVYLSDGDVLQPDIVFISNDRLHIIHSDGLHGAPDLVVELLSPGTERIDRTLKRERYEKFGVGEYWLVGPDSEDNRGVPCAQRRIRAYRRLHRGHGAGNAAAARLALGYKRRPSTTMCRAGSADGRDEYPINVTLH